MELNQTNPNTSLFQLNLDATNSYALRSAASWGKVCAIIGIIFGILFIAVGILVQDALNKSGSPLGGEYEYRQNSKVMGNVGTIGMVMYLFMGVLCIVGSIFLLNFGSKIATALRTNDQNSLRSGFAGLRNYFAYWGVIMIIGLLLTIIGVAGGALQSM